MFRTENLSETCSCHECQTEKSYSSELQYHISSYYKANKCAQETMQPNSEMYVASSRLSALLLQTALT
jgi:hypothetical protein